MGTDARITRGRLIGRAGALAGMVLLGVAALGPGCDGRGAGGGGAGPAVFAAIPYEQALEANKTDGKLLLVKYTAEWCGPCKKMDRDTFSDPSVIALLQQAGTAIEVDIDQHGKLATEAGISAIPTMVLLRGGVEKGRKTGYMGPAEIKAWVAEAGG